MRLLSSKDPPSGLDSFLQVLSPTGLGHGPVGLRCLKVQAQYLWPEPSGVLACLLLGLQDPPGAPVSWVSLSDTEMSSSVAGVPAVRPSAHCHVSISISPDAVALVSLDAQPRAPQRAVR